MNTLVFQSLSGLTLCLNLLRPATHRRLGGFQSLSGLTLCLNCGNCSESLLNIIGFNPFQG